MNLNVEDKTITGQIIVDDTIFTKTKRYFSCKGGFYENRFLQLEYSNDDPKKIQFGVYILELLPNADSLNGKFAGYGSTTQKIVIGDIFFSKVD
jgi:hypothetical protein